MRLLSRNKSFDGSLALFLEDDKFVSRKCERCKTDIFFELSPAGMRAVRLLEDIKL